VRYISVQTVESENGDGSEDEDERSPKLLVTAAVGAVVIGGLVAYAASNLGTVAQAAAFLVAAGGSGYYLSSKDVPTEAAGSASYISAVVLLLTPFALYLPDIVIRGEEVRLFAQDVEASDVSIGGDAFFEAGGLSMGSLTQGNVDGVLQLVLWTVVFTIVALIVVILGRVLKAVAKGKKESA
jgi:hypothetical protein